MACTVPGCSSRQGRNIKENVMNVSFHRFPSDVKLRMQWIQKVKKGDEWSPSPFTRICSLHFEDDCYREGYGRKALHSYAVPTIFSNQRKSSKKRKHTANCNNVDASASSPTFVIKEQPHSILKINSSTQTEDIDEPDLESAFWKAIKLVNHYKTISARRYKSLKNVRRKYSRLSKKNDDLLIIIEALNEKLDSKQAAILKSIMVTDNNQLVIGS